MTDPSTKNFGPIFISYARADAEDFAKRVYDDLLIEKWTPWLDARHLDIGIRFDTAIDEAIQNCGLFVMIITPGSAKSEYCQLEYEAAQKWGKPIAPIMYIQAEPPYFDLKINYIAYAAEAEATTLARLRRAIGAARNLTPQSPETIRAVEQAATAQTLARPIPTNYGTARTRKPNPLPPKSIADFRDRAKERAEIQNYLKSGGHLISIYGQGGVGKTALAVEVLTELEAAADAPEIILALRETRPDAKSLADPGISTEKIFLDIARALGGDDKDLIEAVWTSRLELPQKCQELVQALAGKRCITLIDNVEVLQDPTSHALTDPDLLTFLENILPLSTSFQVLITSRERVALPRSLKNYEKPISLTDGLPPDDAIELLTALDNDGLNRIKQASRPTLEQLVERTKGFPRALEYLAALLKDDVRLTPDALLSDPALLSTEVTKTLADEAFKRLPPDQMRILEGIALYDRPSTLPALQFLLAPYMDAAQLYALLGKLIDSYFVGYNPATKTYALHPLDLAYCKTRIPDGRPEDMTANPPPYTRYALLARAAAYFRSIRLPDDEIAKIRTLEALDPQLSEFGYLVALGDFDTAADVLVRIDYDYLLLWGHARRMVELHSGIVERIADKKLRGISLGKLGIAYWALGQYERAIGFYEQALAIDREIGDRQGEGAVLGNLGSAYYSLGQTERAIGFYEQRLAIAREIGDRRGEGAALGNLGIAYRNLGQTERAIGYHEQDLVIAHEIGDRHGEGAVLGNLGTAYRNLGQSERAIGFYEQQLVIAREIGDRRGEGNALNNMGTAYGNLGQLDRALALYRAALVIYKEIGNPQVIAMTERNIQDVLEKGAK